MSQRAKDIIGVVAFILGLLTMFAGGALVLTIIDANKSVNKCAELRHIGIDAEFRQPSLLGEYWCEIETDRGTYELRF
ncbi:hypothetical protein Wildcat_10 [Mycobacterium phage Wildcat]|uniref:Uncharacterized protein n=3 Tax=Mycobacterium virus Wildcat TaxID=1993859 RepID=Q19Y50_9CAUD|nr:hypothetical protein Wildcat_10 [Mycobacterium phage Wildcat]ABE67615.1 hypothetical protein Wildcat_10 [Mycobacterium phage Wildcat]AQT25681.1 hypothetical protein EniyanLRS_6 [Mycobacterium phage EniyanLRS]QGJ89900.1 hypothetical protein PBI_MARYV_10 [Mycobacterium phage MaryV]WKR36022.1 hypothetical protein [Mycobacterium phage Azrael100]